MEDLFPVTGRNAGAVVLHRNPARAMRAVDSSFDDNRRRAANRIARFSRISQQVAEDLSQQNFIALDFRKLARHVDRRAGGQLVLKVVGGAPRNSTEINRRERELFRARKVQKIGDDLTEGFRFLTDALDIGTILRGNRLRIEQAAIAVYSRKSVAKFMCDAGRQLAQPRQRFLDAQLLFEFDDIGEVGEQEITPRVSAASVSGDTVTPRCVAFIVGDISTVRRTMA